MLHSVSVGGFTGQCFRVGHEVEHVEDQAEMGASEYAVAVACVRNRKLEVWSCLNVVPGSWKTKHS